MTGRAPVSPSEAHERLDAAERAVIEARTVGKRIMAEYADAGHAYYAALSRVDPANAPAIHREHYTVCRPRLFAEFVQRGVRAGLFRVQRDGRTGQTTLIYNR